MVDLIIDYKDRTGHDYHAPFKALTNNRFLAVVIVAQALTDKGFRPTAICHVHGNHSLEELKEFAVSKEKSRGQVFEMLWMDTAAAMENMC